MGTYRSGTGEAFVQKGYQKEFCTTPQMYHPDWNVSNALLRQALLPELLGLSEPLKSACSVQGTESSFAGGGGCGHLEALGGWTGWRASPLNAHDGH